MMYAEYPPELDIAIIMGPIAICNPVDCAMWRMGHQCPNTTDQAIIFTDSKGRQVVLPICSLCSGDVQPADVAADQQATNNLLAHFEFAPEYQQRISITTILQVLKMNGRASEMRIANALKSYGATKERTRDGARWNGMRVRI